MAIIESDIDLVRAFENGDARAFDRLVRKYRAQLVAYCRRLASSAEDADELFQETIIRAFYHIKRGVYVEQDRMLPWLLRIARNLMIDATRSQRREVPIDAEMAVEDGREWAFAEPSPEDEMVSLQISADLSRLVNRLPAPQHDVVRMHYFENMSFKEIAAEMGVSINTALGRAHYAIQNLRQMVAQQRVQLFA